MTIELTPQQSSQLKQAPGFLEVHDPASDGQFVLVPQKDFAYLTSVLNELDNDPQQQGLRRAAARGFASRLASNEL